jgi:hypothetical protein
VNYTNDRTIQLDRGVTDLRIEANTYTTHIIPDLKRRLLKCIQDELEQSIRTFLTDVNGIKHNLSDLNIEVDKGTGLISEIDVLLQQLQQLQ